MADIHFGRQTVGLTEPCMLFLIGKRESAAKRLAVC